MIRVFTVLTVKTQQLENVGRDGPATTIKFVGLHVDHAAVSEILELHHRHLVSKRKFPEIYSVYFTGSYSLDYSAVRYSLLYYLLLI